MSPFSLTSTALCKSEAEVPFPTEKRVLAESSVACVAELLYFPTATSPSFVAVTPVPLRIAEFVPVPFSNLTFLATSSAVAIPGVPSEIDP